MNFGMLLNLVNVQPPNLVDLEIEISTSTVMFYAAMCAGRTLGCSDAVRPASK